MLRARARRMIWTVMRASMFPGRSLWAMRDQVEGDTSSALAEAGAVGVSAARSAESDWIAR